MPKPTPAKPAPARSTPPPPGDAPLGLTDETLAKPAPGEQDGPAAAASPTSATPEPNPPAIAPPKAPPRQDPAPLCPACQTVFMAAYHTSPLKTYYRCPDCGRTDAVIRPAVRARLNRAGR